MVCKTVRICQNNEVFARTCNCSVLFEMVFYFIIFFKLKALLDRSNYYKLQLKTQRGLSCWMEIFYTGNLFSCRFCRLMNSLNSNM